PSTGPRLLISHAAGMYFHVCTYKTRNNQAQVAKHRPGLFHQNPAESGRAVLNNNAYPAI
ncbi:hypothetical protein, partial [Corynebacterium sp. HMSC062A03]|uniref:hypothetical protein n=1 Tax=Corynebacterium sp. HMSC062A03 TaxID=1739285 RepID=UPI001AEF5D60